MNVVTINFIECDTQPPLGYNIQWRVLGTVGSYNNAGNFFTSPAVFYDEDNPSGTQYEGTIQAQGADTDCDLIPWATGSIESPTSSEGEPENVVIINGAGGWTITSVTNIDGFALSGPLTTGNVETGFHNKNNGSAICVNLTFSGGMNAHLTLYVNNVVVQCIPNLSASGSNCFNGTNITPVDDIKVELLVGALC